MTRDHALALDKADKLLFLRDFFELPDGLIHLDANSIGPMPKATRETAKHLLDDWVKLRRRGWAERQWLDMPSPEGQHVEFAVTLFFPWDSRQKLFRGERVYYFMK